MIGEHPEDEILKTNAFRGHQQEKPARFEQHADGAEFLVKIRPGDRPRPGDDQIVLLVGKTLFGNIPAEIENRTTKTRQGCETGLRPRDRPLARIGKDVLDAIGRRRREQRRRQPTSPTPDLENTQRAGARDHPVQPPHHPGCYIVRPAEQRVGIVELLDRVEAPLGRNQIGWIDLRPQDPRKRRTVSRDQPQACEVSGAAGDRLAPEAFR